METKTINMKQARKQYRIAYVKPLRAAKLPVPFSFRRWARLMVSNKSLSFQRPVGKLAAICSR